MRSARRAALFLEHLEDHIVPAAGTLDPTFGSAGKVATDFLGPAHAHFVDDMLVQHDGKVVVAGAARGDTRDSLALTRYLPDGRLDPSFGIGGQVTPSLEGQYAFDFHPSIVQQADGKLLVAAGQSLLRFNVDGSLDAAFSPVTTDVSFFTALIVQRDGKIVTASGDIDAYAVLHRYNSDGTADVTFGGDGRVHVNELYADSFFRIEGLAVASVGGVEKLVATARYDDPASFNSTLAAIRLNPDGSPDSTFSGDGLAFTDVYGEYVDAEAVAIQSDGKVVLAASGSYTTTALVRFNADGSLDNTFDGDGRIYNHALQAYDVAIQADGRIVAAGWTQAPGRGTDFALQRFNADGSQDATFGDGGKAYIELAPRDYAAVVGVAVQADGRIVAAGHCTVYETDTEAFGVVRFNTDGTLDATFAGDGTVLTPILMSVDSSGRATAVQPDGKILVAGADGEYGYDGSVSRYHTNGSLDTTFGDGGRARVGNTFVTDLALQADGKILVLNGYGDVARLNADGSLDTSFGNGEGVSLDVGIVGIAVQPDQKIVLAGTVRGADILVNGGRIDQTSFAVVRLNPDGSPDLSFGVGGQVIADFYARDDWARAVALQADGKIVVVGNSSTDHVQGSTSVGGTAITTSDTAIALVRINPDGTLDDGTPFDTTPGDSFGIAGKVTTPGLSGAEDVAVARDGKVVVARSGGALIRYNADGNLDTGFGIGGVTLPIFETEISYFDNLPVTLAIQDDGKVLVSGTVLQSTPAGYDIAVARFTAAGTLDSTFGTGGLAYADFGDAEDRAAELALQTDGKIVVAGSTASPTSSTGYDLAVVRFRGDLPVLTIDNVSRVEGDKGTTAFTFTLRLSEPGTRAVAVNYSTANGTATAGSDYLAASGIVTFLPGETVKTITVWVYGDKKKENDETFFLNLTGATNAYLDTPRAVGTILDDDRHGGGTSGSGETSPPNSTSDDTDSATAPDPIFFAPPEPEDPLDDGFSPIVVP